MEKHPIPQPAAGEMLTRALYVSVDPYMRGRMRDVKSYAPPVALGAVMGGGAVSEVVSSNLPGYAPGDCVVGNFGWQDYALSDGVGVRKVDRDLAPVSTALGVLGMPGLTAYFGLLDIGQPKPGETVLVSGGAGAVGSLVGQLARIKECRAVGIAGSDAKVAHMVNELGFSAAFNYKTESNYTEKISALCPDGVDVYFDNVGGDLSDQAFPLLNRGARVPICGQISQYNLEKPELGPRLLWHLIVKQARVEGFLVFQFAEKYAQGLREMAQWLKEGRLKYQETLIEGLENTPGAFIGMMRGDNTGKMVIRI